MNLNLLSFKTSYFIKLFCKKNKIDFLNNKIYYLIFFSISTNDSFSIRTFLILIKIT